MQHKLAPWAFFIPLTLNALPVILYYFVVVVAIVVHTSLKSLTGASPSSCSSNCTTLFNIWLTIESLEAQSQSSYNLFV
ncbi:hypothetical protein BpHYR1_032926 [Brachionus plicatilis]|uniref:Uncharacterized protein n=1 Tax=Brachionus plicatilis TaxID=10195 RepID=A0A3M7SWP0_BRAPC|nr:hypothetical protein BpHYR1_032926 [Brachionus plicatilis]